MLITHNLRVLHEANPTLARLIADRHLLPCPGEVVHASPGVVYRSAPALLDRGTVSALSDIEMQLGPGIFPAHVHALPPEEYAGLLLGSPGFRQHDDVRCLIEPLTQALSLDERQEWRQALVAALLREARSDSTPLLLPHPPARPATWLPEGTRLVHGRAGWFLCLAFELPDQRPGMTVNRSAVGIDVGLRTLAVASYKSGLIHRARGIADVPLDTATLAHLLPGRPDLWFRAQLMGVAVQHAAARAELAQFTTLLLAAASTVGYEQLTYKDTDERFKRRSRQLGLRDYLAVWLPSRLRQQGLIGQAVAPHLSSVICNRTYHGGTRDQDHLHVSSGDHHTVVDADENAASNIRDLALAHLIQAKSRGLTRAS
ncbi:hypothetical protein [Deinococcus aestuarii]|uniref:hypothetical protein n=1 Tax=Deinococcus aestuarii TaxID=2774531 RepID=UPI001C0B950F|nr:hypothetical protein [Deinococcus aestuarii]